MNLCHQDSAPERAATRIGVTARAPIRRLVAAATGWRVRRRVGLI
jgi:hypothetical protein